MKHESDPEPEVFEVGSSEDENEVLKKANQTCSDSEERETFAVTDEFLKRAGFMDAEGTVDPVVRAMLEQEMIDLQRDRRFKRLLNPDVAYNVDDSDEGVDGFSEELDEDQINEIE